MPNEYYGGYSSPTYRPSPFSSLDLTGMGSWGTMPAGGVGTALSAATSGLSSYGSSGIPAPGTVSIPGITPGTTGAGSLLGSTGGLKLGFNMPTAQLALSGLSTIGNLWAAFNAQKLAREQFNYTKSVTDTNLANQIQTYNTGITDRANNRAIVEGRTPDQTKAYIDANSLRRYG